jgi:oligosaccharide repeat unit polymerase
MNYSSIRHGYVLAFATLLLLALSAALSLVSAEESLLTLFLAFLSFSLWLQTRAGEFDLFSPEVAFPVAYVVFLALGGINIPLETEFGMKLPANIWLVYSLGLGGYLAGVTLFQRGMPTPGRLPSCYRFWDSKRFVLAGALVLVAGLAGKVLDLRRFGLLILHPQAGELRMASSGGILGVLSLCLEVVFVALIAYIAIVKKQRSGRWIAGLTAAIILLMLATSTSRTGLLRVAIPSLVIIHYVRRRLSLKIVIPAAIAAFVFAALLGTFRDTAQMGGDAHIRSLEAKGFNKYTYWLMNGYELVRLPAEDLHMVMQEIPEFQGYSYGSVSASALLQVLPGHHPGPSEILKEKVLRMDFVGYGAACTILGALWADGGYLAVLLGMFILGVAAKFLYSAMMKRHNVFWLMVYAWFLQNQLKAIKDDILSDLGPAFVLTMVLFIHILCTAKWSDAPGPSVTA